ncbi:unnamed protein product [Closterium sp. NIES-53]
MRARDRRRTLTWSTTTSASSTNRRRTRRRRKTKILLKERKKVRPRPRSTPRTSRNNTSTPSVSSSSSSTTSTRSTSSSSRSANSSTHKSNSSNSTSSSNTSSSSSSSKTTGRRSSSGSSTSRSTYSSSTASSSSTSSPSTSSTTRPNSSSTSSTSTSSSSSTAPAPSKPLAQLFFEGCSPSPLAPSYASAAAVDVLSTEDVGAASASAKRRSSKGKGGRGGGGGSGGGGGGSGGSGGGSGGVGGGGGGSAGSGGSGSGGSGGGRTGAQCGGTGRGQRQRSGVAIIDLDYDSILSAMYALSASAEGDCYRCEPPDPDIEAAALGAGESSLPGTAPAEALHTFILDAGASCCFFRDNTTLTPFPAPVPVRLADPSEVDCCLFLHCPPLSDGFVQLTVRSSPPLVLYELGSSLYTLATEPLQVAASAQLSASGQVATSCSCRLLSHQNLLWHHRLGHPSLPCLRGMHSRLLVSGLPRSLPPLPPSPAPPCLPCVEGRQRAAPHSSSFPSTTAPLQTLHMDVWSPARVVDVLIPWIRAVRLQLRERFRADLPVLRLHSDRGSEFSSDLLRDFCRGEGILQSFTLPDSPQQNGIVERRIGLVMEVARTSMIHAAAPHFWWPFAVRYAAHQLNLWPRVSLPQTSPTLRWTGEFGDASVFRVWGSRAFVCDMTEDKLSARAIPCVFLGFFRDALGRQFYHPTLRRVFPSQDIAFDESVPFYRLFPYRFAPPPPLPLFLDPDPLFGPAPVEVAIGSGAASGAASGGAASGGAEPGGAESEGAGSGGAELGGEEPGGVEPGGAESEGAESGGAEPWGAALSGGPAGASPRLSPQQQHEWLVRRARLWRGATGAGGAGDAGAGGTGVIAGAGGTRGAATAGPGGSRTRGTRAAGIGGVGGTRAGDPTEHGAAGAGGYGAGGAGAGGAGSGGTGAGGAGAGGAGVGGTSTGGAGAGGTDTGGVGAGEAGAVDPGGPVRPRPYFFPLLQQPRLLSASPLPTPSPYTEHYGGLTECREPASRPVSPVCTARHVPRSRPPPVPGTHAVAHRPSSAPLRVPLPAPPESSLLKVPDPESDRARAASPTVSRLLATAITDPFFDSTATSALVAKLLDFDAACRLDYAIALVAESESASPPSVGGECALGMDVLEDRQEDFECLAVVVPCFASMLLALEGDPDAPDILTLRSYAEAITGPYSSQWQAAMDAEMASWKSTGTYVDEVPLPGANIVDGMWIFRVKRPPGSPPAFKAHYVAQGFSQQQGVDYFQTFFPTPKMTTLWVFPHFADQRNYELHSLDFSRCESTTAYASYACLPLLSYATSSIG